MEIIQKTLDNSRFRYITILESKFRSIVVDIALVSVPKKDVAELKLYGQ
jgi:hypothetical protein